MAWIAVLVRKHYFTTHLDDIVSQELAKAPTTPAFPTFSSFVEKGKDIGRASKDLGVRVARTFTRHPESETELRPRAVAPGEIRVIAATRQNTMAMTGEEHEGDGQGAMTSSPEPLSPLALEEHAGPISNFPDMPSPPPSSTHFLSNSPTPLSPTSLHPDGGAQTSATSVRFSEDADQDLRRRALDARFRMC